MINRAKAFQILLECGARKKEGPYSRAIPPGTSHVAAWALFWYRHSVAQTALTGAPVVDSTSTWGLLPDPPEAIAWAERTEKLLIKGVTP